MRSIKKLFSRMIDWVLYTLLTERQKKFLANLFTERQKETIKRITKIGKRHSQRRLLKQIHDHLYSKGFTKRAYEELVTMLKTYEKDTFMKRLISWELALWHANQLTAREAKQALHFLAKAKEGEENQEQLRKISIMEAECYEHLKENERGKEIIRKQLNEEEHPDLYLAMANLEESLTARLQWINQAFIFYNLQPITFERLDAQTTYSDLQTEPIQTRAQTGPKVSVLLPAYNAEDDIQIAIESMLQQTWENLEIIVIDDCSTDQTVSIIKKYMEKDDRIKLYSTPENSGPYVARNIGLKQATGEFVTVNDADDWSHAEKIEIQARHLIDHPKVIANTSEHARLTEQLKLYRRGTPGRYIFPNMSSLMFRRQPVLETLGFWDSVRFAADGEFKRRLIKQFGASKVVDIETGPLSLPKQSATSLTGSPAFGYNGFFMGVRKEYVESLEFHHQRAESLYYPYPQQERPFPVPDPMLPKRELAGDRRRSFDLVIATDFRIFPEEKIRELYNLKKIAQRIGLVQLYRYDLTIEEDIHPSIREMIDGERIQRIVYGERIKTDKLLIIDHQVLLEYQRYVPNMQVEDVHVFITTHTSAQALNKAASHLHEYVGLVGTWYPLAKIERTKEVHSNIQLSNKRLGSLRNYV